MVKLDGMLSIYERQNTKACMLNAGGVADRKKGGYVIGASMQKRENPYTRLTQVCEPWPRQKLAAKLERRARSFAFDDERGTRKVGKSIKKRAPGILRFNRFYDGEVLLVFYMI